MELRIDVDVGTVELPTGLRLAATCTANAARADPRLAAATVRTGAPPWLHLDFAAGSLDGRELLATATFHAQELRWLSLTLRLPHHDAAQEKAAHDRLASALLGLAHNEETPPSGGAIGVLRPKWWTFAWGRVGSLHDAIGGGARLRIEYRGASETP